VLHRHHRTFPVALPNRVLFLRVNCPPGHLRSRCCYTTVDQTKSRPTFQTKSLRSPFAVIFGAMCRILCFTKCLVDQIELRRHWVPNPIADEWAPPVIPTKLPNYFPVHGRRLSRPHNKRLRQAERHSNETSSPVCKIILADSNCEGELRTATRWRFRRDLYINTALLAELKHNLFIPVRRLACVTNHTSHCSCDRGGSSKANALESSSTRALHAAAIWSSVPFYYIFEAGMNRKLGLCRGAAVANIWIAAFPAYPSHRGGRPKSDLTTIKR
jgi:hypothetical protein